MSVDLINGEIAKFLSTGEPGVLCLKVIRFARSYFS